MEIIETILMKYSKIIPIHQKNFIKIKVIPVYPNNFTNIWTHVKIYLKRIDMLIREKYLSEIRDFYDETSLIKIIYGLRRIGKWVILTQIIDEIKQK